MLENLRRKSLTKTYHDPIHQVHFESGLAKYENHAEIDVCTQKLSKKKPTKPIFPRVISRISPESFSYFKLVMIACPSGTFTMGHEDEDDNKPRTEIIERPFLLGETEITQELYEKVMGTNPSWFKNRPQNPIEMVSWVDAIKFCNELSRLQGLDEYYTENSNREDFGWDYNSSKNGYRLPREKEWEYAAKAGTQNLWSGTDDESKLQEYAWFEGDWGTGTTHPVATKKPNEWGFYDMSGNVSEWCWDKYNPKGGANADRVARGGSWYDRAWNVCSASRNNYSPNSLGLKLGFRVARLIVN